MLKRRRQSQELAQRIPAQVVLFQELLNVLRCRATGTRFKQATTVHQRYDREHLGAGAQFHDREQVGEVIAQHVTSDGDGVFAFTDTLQRNLHRIDRRENSDIQASGVVIFQVRLDLLDQLRVVGTVSVEPEQCRGTAIASASHGQLHPILNRRVFGLAHTPDIACFYRVAKHSLA